jgi:predicted P-loop ATPase
MEKGAQDMPGKEASELWAELRSAHHYLQGFVWWYLIFEEKWMYLEQTGILLAVSTVTL